MTSFTRVLLSQEPAAPPEPSSAGGGGLPTVSARTVKGKTTSAKGLAQESVSDLLERLDAEDDAEDLEEEDFGGLPVVTAKMLRARGVDLSTPQPKAPGRKDRAPMAPKSDSVPELCQVLAKIEEAEDVSEASEAGEDDAQDAADASAVEAPPLLEAAQVHVDGPKWSRVAWGLHSSTRKAMKAAREAAAASEEKSGKAGERKVGIDKHTEAFKEAENWSLHVTPEMIDKKINTPAPQPVDVGPSKLLQPEGKPYTLSMEKREYYPFEEEWWWEEDAMSPAERMAAVLGKGKGKGAGAGKAPVAEAPAFSFIAGQQGLEPKVERTWQLPVPSSCQKPGKTPEAPKRSEGLPGMRGLKTPGSASRPSQGRRGGAGESGATRSLLTGPGDDERGSPLERRPLRCVRCEEPSFCLLAVQRDGWAVPGGPRRPALSLEC
mmetsp:Transcript_125179/g.279270  ORF Transcript_125179/g.279270 Transcript_125179/m.279270 type:complete len:435 (-) Transcript_125179:30-1334(-)